MGILEITNLSHSIGDKILYKNAEFELFKGEHIGIVGHKMALAKPRFYAHLSERLHQIPEIFVGKKISKSATWTNMLK